MPLPTRNASLFGTQAIVNNSFANPMRDAMLNTVRRANAEPPMALTIPHHKPSTSYFPLGAFFEQVFGGSLSTVLRRLGSAGALFWLGWELFPSTWGFALMIPTGIYLATVLIYGLITLAALPKLRWHRQLFVNPDLDVAMVVNPWQLVPTLAWSNAWQPLPLNNQPGHRHQGNYHYVVVPKGYSLIARIDGQCYTLLQGAHLYHAYDVRVEQPVPVGIPIDAAVASPAPCFPVLGLQHHAPQALQAPTASQGRYA